MRDRLRQHTPYWDALAQPAAAAVTLAAPPGSGRVTPAAVDAAADWAVACWDEPPCAGRLQCGKIDHRGVLEAASACPLVVRIRLAVRDA